MAVADPTGRRDSPYVGLRPFERDERHLFFGRDRDATILCDRILGARLTLLYAQSGLGKSSLLRTLVAPQLEAEQCRVVYFDAWTGNRPADALNAALARAGGVGAAAESLLQAARAAARASDRTVVLLLDQFEEFLIAHAQRLDPLREELGALVRAKDVDVRVVLSLREELLGALDPFRHAVVDLYQSTHRLEPLTTEAVREAIARPAQLAGGAVADDLVETLIRDLRAENDAGPGAPGDAASAEAVDLPMLQLVCRELWASAEAPGVRPELTAALYRATGGARAVLDRYVLGIMPSGWADRLVVARLMRMLAPPSGFKVSYSVEDLMAGTGIARAPVEAAIELLGRARIVRAREVGHGRRYELQHDAFIRILAPWRDEVLRRAGVRRRLWQAAAALGAVAFLGAAAAALIEWRDRAELERNTRGVFAELRREATRGETGRADAAFASATNYLLWQRSEPARFERLRALLQENVDLLPPAYGLDESAHGVIAPAPEDWPAVVAYAPGRELDAAQFRTRWHNHATFMASRWGVPIPLRIRVRVEEALPRERLRLTLTGAPPLNADGVPSHEELFVVSSRALAGPARGFVDAFAAEWRELPQLGDRWPSYAVPLWSLPVWRGAGATVQGGSVLPATMIFQEIQRRPELVITPEAAEVLLKRVAASYPHTVGEARRARGTALHRDLAELVRREIPLSGLATILDDLADHPGAAPSQAAAAVARSTRDAAPAFGAALPAPWPGEPDAPAAPLNERLIAAFGEAEPWLPRVEPPVRIDIGPGLEARWLRAGALRDEVLDALEKVREALFDRFGIVLPAVSFRFANDIPGDSFRIAVLNQEGEDEDARPIRTTADESVFELADAVAERGERFRKRWITADSVADDLAALGPRTQEWVSARYSLTDLKHLLRRAATAGPGSASALALSADALLTTLPFWDARGGGQDAARLADAMASVRLPASPGSVDRDLARGLDALFDDDPEGAATAFAAARRAPGAADAAFVGEFRRRWAEVIAGDADDRCHPPFTEHLSLAERSWLLRVSDGREASPSESARRRASLCLLAEFARQHRRPREAELLAGIVARSGALAAWPPEEADWLATHLLARFDIGVDRPDQLAFASRLLRGVIDEGDPARHGALVRAWILACQKPGPMNWCWTAVDQLAEHDRIAAYATIELALALSASERRRDLLRAVELAGRAERQIARDSATWLSEAEAKRLAPFVLEARARALAGLATYHRDEAADVAALDALRQLGSLPAYAETAAALEVVLHRARGRARDAARRIDAFLAVTPTSAVLLDQRLWLAIESGDGATALAALDALELADEASQYGFSVALGRMMTRSGEWEERTLTVIKQGVYFADYARMILSALKAGDAQEESDELVARRAREMRRDSWPARLRGGDGTAWREMLLAFVAGDVPREEVFAELTDESRFAASALAALAMPRAALLCEAHFYDAVRARKAGDAAAMAAALRAAVAADYPAYYEHAMARFLLAEEERR